MPTPVTLKSPDAAYPFESRTVDVLGHRIHYIEEGRGKPVLFVHGNPTSSYLWRNVLPHVAKETGRRAIALDLLGFGSSDKPADVRYTLELHASVLRGFVDALSLEELLLVADDWGGPLSAHLAVSRPQRVTGLLLMESFLWTMTWEEDFSPEFRTPFRLIRSPLGFVMVQVLNMMIKKLIPQHCPISPAALQRYIGAFPTISSRKAMREFPRLLPVSGEPAESVEFFEWMREGLRRSPIPIGWIKASPGVVPSDDYPPSLKRFQDLRRDIPRLKVIEFGPGHHFLAEENPERVAELVSLWVKGG
ncbi:MAG: haloalkane dehalogenase [Elusimicrobia bacterium]|nr:haloalkane dehalogenase [Elusimicrobiota bacterium]